MNSENKNKVVKIDESLNNVDTVVTRNVNIQEITEVEGSKKNMKKTKKTKNSDKLGFNWVLFVCMIIIAIPCGVFLWILLSAMQDTGTPILGNRFLGDLDPAIETAQVETIQGKIAALDGVEDCDVNLIVATMRIHVDADDSLTNENVAVLASQVYEVVNEVLPVETYFTLVDDQKQYDLEINVYNDLSLDDGFIMYNIVKNSAMETYRLQDVSTPIDADLAQDLRDYVVEREKAKEEAANAANSEDDSQDETTEE